MLQVKILKKGLMKNLNNKNKLDALVCHIVINIVVCWNLSEIMYIGTHVVRSDSVY